MYSSFFLCLFKTMRRRSRVKELATWFEEKVIVRPDQIPEKNPNLKPEQPLNCPKTYDSNNNKRVVGELINFFCSQDPPRPRPQPISEARINVMNLIETFERKTENSSRHYPFIPLHVERFVWNTHFHCIPSYFRLISDLSNFHKF